MVKINNIQLEDRNIIYKMLQQSEDITSQEISSYMSKIDRLLFEKNATTQVLVARSVEDQLIGLIIFSNDPTAENTYFINKIWVSPLNSEENLDEILLGFVELEIQKKNGRLILLRLPSDEKHRSIRHLLLNQKYSCRSHIANYYSPGVDQYIYGKYLTQLDRTSQ